MSLSLSFHVIDERMRKGMGKRNDTYFIILDLMVIPRSFVFPFCS